MAIMKAITVWQPWATLILQGAKPYEFRRWKPPTSLIGQRIAIHAGSRPVRRDEVAVLQMQLLDPHRYGQPCLHAPLAVPVLDIAYRNPKAGALPLSHVLCTAILGEPKPGHECASEFGENAGNDSDREGTFNWGWPLTDIERLVPPVPSRGAQGFWNWSNDNG
ncbi:UNVERIFIED_ORG: ASCH domain-containing protein [Roseateles sp. XES5]|nr:ASCH domain-containing protein [Roseateles sp. XES5]